MSDKFFDDVDWYAEKFGYDPMSDDEIVNRFSVHGRDQRIAWLRQIHDSNEEVTDLRKTARSQKLARRMNGVHQALVKVGR